jgi:hypothetical protein
MEFFFKAVEAQGVMRRRGSNIAGRSDLRRY